MEKVRCKYCILSYYYYEIVNILSDVVSRMDKFAREHGGWRDLSRGVVEVGRELWMSFIDELKEFGIYPLFDLLVEVGEYHEFSVVSDVIDIIVDGIKSQRNLYKSYKKLSRLLAILEGDLKVYTRRCLDRSPSDAEEAFIEEIVERVGERVCGKKIRYAMKDVL